MQYAVGGDKQTQNFSPKNYREEPTGQTENNQIKNYTRNCGVQGPCSQAVGMNVLEQPIVPALFCAEDVRRTVQRLQYYRRTVRCHIPAHHSTDIN
jgi:hypothetical protein